MFVSINIKNISTKYLLLSYLINVEICLSLYFTNTFDTAKMKYNMLIGLRQYSNRLASGFDKRISRNDQCTKRTVHAVTQKKYNKNNNNKK